MLKLGYHPNDIYQSINEIVCENLTKIIDDYLKEKNA